MLNTFRENLKRRSWPKWLLLVVALSLTLYLANFFADGGGSDDPRSGNWAAKVAGEEIPTRKFLDRARQIDQSYRQLFGTNYNQFREQFQIGRQAVQELVEERIILNDARRLGLSVSREELIEEIRSIPELSDASGTFVGKREYETRLRNYPGGVVAFERRMADELLIEKWTDLVSQPISIDESDLEAVYRERNEKTAADFFVVPSADQEIETAISDGDALRWYEQHPDDYRRKEGRNIRYVTFEREARTGESEISEEEIAAAYESSQARFTHPEQRRARHILFRVEQQASDEEKQRVRQRAEDALRRVQAGEDFAALARELSEDTFSGQRGGDLDWFGRGQMVGPFEEAAFSTAPGELAPLTETEFGFHVIQVTDAREAGTMPLEDVRPQLLSELQLSRAEELMLAEAARIRDRIDSAESFDAVLQEEGLEVTTTFVNEDQGLREIGASTEFSSTVLAMEAGEISRPLRVARGVAIVMADEIVPAGVAPFEAVDQKVRTDLLNERARQAAFAAAERALEGAGDLPAAAAPLNLEVRESGDLAPRQVLPATGGNSPELQAALFGDAVAVGDRGVVPVPAGALAYEITRREPFDAPAFQAARESLRAELLLQRRQGMRRSMVDQLGRQMEIVINDEVVRRVDGGA